MKANQLVAVVIVLVFLFTQFNENIWPYIAPRTVCEEGYVPAEDNPKLCVPETIQEPSYFPVLKESIFMLLIFVALTYIFTRK